MTDEEGDSLVTTVLLVCVAEEERSWYAKQLKASKRQTRLLLAGMEGES